MTTSSPAVSDDSGGSLRAILRALRAPTQREQVEAIGRWAVEHGIWVVTDEIY